MTWSLGLDNGTLNHFLVLPLFLLSTVVLSWIFYPAYVVAVAKTVPIQEDCVSASSSGTGSTVNKSQPQQTLLSIVIPAYNEEERLPIMLDSALEYLTNNRTTILDKCRAIALARGECLPRNDSYSCIEWLVVSDGSIDGTCQVVKQYGEKYGKGSGKGSNQDSWKLIQLVQNGGKGTAVKAGMLRTTGQICLMVDADGATEFGSGIEAVLEGMRLHYTNAKNNNSHTRTKGAAVFGSRAHLVKGKSVAKRSLVRNLLMHAFQFFVKFFVTSNVQDTQCGFKLFTRDACMAVFGNLHLRRWAFDTEVVVRCERSGIPISEVSVTWHEVDGSKLSTGKLALALASLSMLRDMICVRACYTLQIWKDNKQ